MTHMILQNLNWQLYSGQLKNGPKIKPLKPAIAPTHHSFRVHLKTCDSTLTGVALTQLSIKFIKPESGFN